MRVRSGLQHRQDELCPQNLLTSFSGPGVYTSGGRGQSSNSTFITVAPIPEDLTIVTVTGQRLGYWINSHSFKVNFISVPPAVASKNNFVAAPIQSITYGISLASSLPQPGAPVPDDVTVPNTACPAPGGSNHRKLPPSPLLGEGESVPDGWPIPVALLCPGLRRHRRTEVHQKWGELVDLVLHFPHQCGHGRSRKLKTGPTLSPAPTSSGYQLGQKVTATYSCTDDRSGIVHCGAAFYLLGKAEHRHYQQSCQYIQARSANLYSDRSGRCGQHHNFRPRQLRGEVNVTI